MPLDELLLPQCKKVVSFSHVKMMPLILIKLKLKTKIHLNRPIRITQVVSYIVRM